MSEISHDKILPETKAIDGTTDTAQRNISPNTMMLDKGTAIKLLSKK
jgi:hypothetical protein